MHISKSIIAAINVDAISASLEVEEVITTVVVLSSIGVDVEVAVLLVESGTGTTCTRNGGVIICFSR